MVASFDFSCPPKSRPFLENLKNKVEGLEVDTVLGLKDTNIGLPLFFLKETLREHRSPYDMINYKDDLVCRCFNVGCREIESWAQREGLRQVGEVTEKTRAGGGCTSCLADIKEILVGVHSGVAHRR